MAIELSGGTLATYANTAPSDSFTVASGRIDNDPTAGQSGVGQLRGDPGTFFYSLVGSGISQVIADGRVVGYQLSGSFGTLTLATDGRYQYVPNAAQIKASAGSTNTDTFQIVASTGSGLQTTQTAFTVAITGAGATTATLTGGQLAAYADTSANDTFALATGMFDTDRTGTSNGIGNLTGGTGPVAYALVGAGVSSITSGGTVVGTQLTGTYGTLTVANDGRYQFEPNQRTLNALPAGTTSLPYTLEVTGGNGTTATATYTIALTGAGTAPTLSSGVLATYANTAPADSFTVASGRIDNDPTAAQNGVGQLRGDPGTFFYSLSGAGTSQITANGAVVGYQLSGSFGTLTLATDGRYQYVPNAAQIKASAGSTNTDTFQIVASTGSGLQTTQTGFTVAITGGGASAVTLSGGRLAAYTDTPGTGTTFALASGTLDTDRTAASNGIGNLTGGTGAVTYALTGAGVSSITTGGTVVGTQFTNTYGTLTLATDGRYQFEPNQRALDTLPAGTTSASYAVQATDAAGTVATATYTIALTGAGSAPTLSTGTLATYSAASETFGVASGRIDNDPTAAQNGVGQLRGDPGTFFYSLNGAGTTQITADGTLVGYQQPGLFGTLTLATDGRYQYVPYAAAIRGTSAATDTFQILVLSGNGLSTTPTTFTVAITKDGASAATLADGQSASHPGTDDGAALGSRLLDGGQGGAAHGSGNGDLLGGTTTPDGHAATLTADVFAPARPDGAESHVWSAVGADSVDHVAAMSPSPFPAG